jgi:hypothetical protein
MKTKIKGLFLGLFALSVLFGCVETKTVKMPKVLKEYWMDFQFLGEKVGYMHVIHEEGAFMDKDAISIKTEMYMKMNRLDVDIENYSVDTYYLDNAMKPLGFLFLRKVTGMKDKTITGTVEGTDLFLTLSDGNETRDKKLGIPGDFSFDDAVLEKLKLAGYKPGDKADYSIFVDADMKIVPATKEVLEKDGDLIPVVTTIKASMPFKIKEYFTPEGSPEKAEYVDMGMVFIPTTKEKAESGYPGLVLASSTVKADKWLKDPGLIRKLRLKVVSDKEDLQNLFVSDGLQKVVKKDQDIILENESVSGAESNKLNLPLDESLKKQLADYLAPTEMIQSDNPLVRDKASDLEGVETDVWKLSIWITQKVRKLLLPSSDMAFASAVEALDKGRGDCTEYAMVFAALARALGIPVKVCYGMVSTGTDEFLFHAWNEVYAGRWIPIDAALDQDQVDATHIALYKGPGNDLLDTGAKIMKAMARLRFEVVEIKYATGEQGK